jgi:prevent-host-death family protein
METVNIYEAKTHFSRYVEKAESGEDVIIARGGRQVARLTAIAPHKPPVRFGVLKGKVRLAEDFDAPLPETVLAGFEGR